MANEMSDVIVVDDDAVLLSVLAEIFSERGYTVRTASDGFAALTEIRNRVPDILISDLNMPGMSGFELLSVIRRRFPTIAVIAMSGEYSGLAISPGIAADGFYAKGSSSVARLLDILREIDDAATRQARRASAPIWIPGLPIHRNDVSTTAVACPECLRVFTQRVDSNSLSPQESWCPHCLSPVQLAIVGQSESKDRVRFSLWA